MGNRRKSRELAVQSLFFMDMNQKFTEENLMLFSENFISPSQEDIRPFFYQLVRGVACGRHEIDALIERFSDNWKVSRMSSVDRNIMRIAVFEMLICRDIPVKVSINEAVDLGKKFGTDESGAFVNGILDSIRMAMETESLSIAVGENCRRIPEAADIEIPISTPEDVRSPSEHPLIVIDTETLPAEEASEGTAISESLPESKPRRRTVIR